MQLQLNNPLEDQPKEWLYHTWCFRLTMFSFLLLSTKYILVAVRGYMGVFVILGLAVIAALAEKSATTVLRNVRRVWTLNSFMVLLAVWYAIGVFYKMTLKGATDTDLRLLSSPVLLILGLLYGFGFLHDDRSTRLFQILFIVMVGIQSVFTGWIIAEDSEGVRTVIVETEGGWAFGDQGGFAMQAMLMPVLIWRSFAEKGIMRLLLLAGCVVILWVLTACQFATPLGLLFISFPTATIFLLWNMRHKLNKTNIIIIMFMLFSAWQLLTTMQKAPLMFSAKDRIEKAWDDPTSGGYHGSLVASGSRWNLAQISIDSFYENPLFGVGEGSIRLSRNVGGHSAFFDMLGFYGLLGGGGAFIIMLLLMLTRAIKRLHRQIYYDSVATATSVVLLIAGGIVNPYWEGETTVIVMLMCRLYRLPQEPA